MNTLSFLSCGCLWAFRYLIHRYTAKRLCEIGGLDAAMRLRLLADPEPSLPPFSALLVHGTYPPSAPIHLCLSIPPGQKAILLSPTRQLLLQSVASCHDNLLQSSGSGAISSISSRVSILLVRSNHQHASNSWLRHSYPPTPKHLVAFLASIRCHGGATATATDGVEPRSIVDPAPCLLVLYEPSAYFLQENGQDQ